MGIGVPAEFASRSIAEDLSPNQYGLPVYKPFPCFESSGRVGDVGFFTNFRGYKCSGNAFDAKVPFFRPEPANGSGNGKSKMALFMTFGSSDSPRDELSRLPNRSRKIRPKDKMGSRRPTRVPTW
jgi:hypothetical protein